MGVFHQRFCPMIVCDIRSASNFVDFCRRIGGHRFDNGDTDPHNTLAAYCRRSPSFRFLRQKFHFHASSWPFSLRRSAIGEMPSIVMYSTHSDISCTVPLPTLPLTYASHSSCLINSKIHGSRNDCFQSRRPSEC